MVLILLLYTMKKVNHYLYVEYSVSVTSIILLWLVFRVLHKFMICFYFLLNTRGLELLLFINSYWDAAC